MLVECTQVRSSNYFVSPWWPPIIIGLPYDQPYPSGSQQLPIRTRRWPTMYHVGTVASIQHWQSVINVQHQDVHTHIHTSCVILRELTFTPSLTRLCTWFGFSGALLSQMLVSSLRMANTLPRPHPPFRVHRLGVDESDRWSRDILLWLTTRPSALTFFEPHFRVEIVLITWVIASFCSFNVTKIYL